jgi:hypothetical protein
MADDLVLSGLVSSLAHPGSNTTGVSILATELDGSWPLAVSSPTTKPCERGRNTGRRRRHLHLVCYGRGPLSALQGAP